MFNRFPKHIKSHSIIVSPGGPSVIIDDHASQGVGEYIVYFDITRLTQADVIHLSVLINPSGNASKAPVLYLESEIPKITPVVTGYPRVPGFHVLPQINCRS